MKIEDLIGVTPLADLSDEELAAKILEIRKQRRTPVPKKAKAKAKAKPKKDKLDVSKMSPKQVEELLAALQAQTKEKP